MGTWFDDMSSNEMRHLVGDINAQEFEHVFRVTPKGAISGPDNVYAPQVENDPTGDITIHGDGWTALTNYTGQHAYRGAVMHSSEYIGGQLAHDIIQMSADTPLLWTVTTAETDDPDNPAGWVVLYREEGK